MERVLGLESTLMSPALVEAQADAILGPAYWLESPIASATVPLEVVRRELDKEAVANWQQRGEVESMVRDSARYVDTRAYVVMLTSKEAEAIRIRELGSTRLSFAELGRQLGVSRSTAWGRYRRAANKLRVPARE